MIWVILVGGQGKRTRALGEFKPFIEILGHKMLSWFICSIKHNVRPEDTLVFPTTQYFAVKYHVEREVAMMLRSHGLPNSFSVLVMPKDAPPGPSGGVYSARLLLQTDEPVTVACCDAYIDFDLPEVVPRRSAFVTLAPEFTGKRRGYVAVERGTISHFEEHVPISCLRSVGIYVVSDGMGLIKALEKQFAGGQTYNGEYVPSMALKYLPDLGYTIYPLAVLARYSLGDMSGIERSARPPSALSLSQTLASGAALH